MYEHFFNLHSSPFKLSPNPEFFYDSSGHKRALSYLRFGVSREEGFIIITGGVGVGKTTLAGALLSELNPDEIVAGQLVSTSVGPAGILGLVCNVFGLPYSEKTSKPMLLKMIQKFLLACHDNNRRVLLIVDEAQNLPIKTIEELRMLSNFMVDNAPLLQTFLLGQAEFRDTVSGPGMEQLRQRVIASYHLKPLAEEEVYEYVYHRLKHAGFTGYEIFTKDACLEIHKHTNGIPRKINVLCDRVMLLGSLEENHILDVDMVSAVVSDLAEEPTAFQSSTVVHSNV
ncbi:MAG: XrtA/PEP-CTERM system-associated ATPase [Gammaproteobacteria bacterium]